MHVNNAGHGVSIGVEPVGSSSYLWMKCDSDEHSNDGRGTALARFKFVNGGTPSMKKFLAGSDNGSVTFQGYTMFGKYLYTLDGTGHQDPADINSYVTAIDMNTGKVVQRSLTKAGKTLFYREPEARYFKDVLV